MATDPGAAGESPSGGSVILVLVSRSRSFSFKGHRMAHPAAGAGAGAVTFGEPGVVSRPRFSSLFVV